MALPPRTWPAAPAGGPMTGWRTATGGGAAGWRLPARDRRQKPGSTFSMLLPTTTRTVNTTCIAQHVTQLETSSSPQGRSRLSDQMFRRKPNASCTREKGRGFKPHGVQRCPSVAIMVWYITLPVITKNLIASPHLWQFD